MSDRKIQQIHINPMNGSILVLADDATLWVRDGSLANHNKPWKQVTDLPPINPPKEESEDALTTIVK